MVFKGRTEHFSRHTFALKFSASKEAKRNENKGVAVHVLHDVSCRT